jgi:hypothetical protein
MKKLTEMSAMELNVVEKQIRKNGHENAIEADLDKMITSLDHKLGFGKYSDRTLREIITTDPQYVVWLIDKTSDKMSLLDDDMRVVNTVIHNMRMKSLVQRKNEILEEIKALDKKNTGKSK